MLVESLSDDQKALLTKFGVDEDNLPTSISQEQQDCAINAIGTERLNEILSGSTPTFSELLKAKSCM